MTLHLEDKKTRHVNDKAILLLSMVNFCAIYGCLKRADRDKELRFYRIPAVKTNANKILQDLQKERFSLWLRIIRWADIDDSKCTYLQVCSLHFATGKPMS